MMSLYGRPCRFRRMEGSMWQSVCSEEESGHFHGFDKQGNAIIETEDGDFITTESVYVKMLDTHENATLEIQS